jgi:hypothetical protein
MMATRRIRTDGLIDPCIPTLAAKPPSGPDWIHEIKHDGYRLIVRRDGKAVRMFTLRGYDWTDRYPAIAATAAKLRAKSFTLDGEAVVTGDDGVAVFDALHRRHKAADAMLYAFRFGGTRRQGSPATAPLARALYLSRSITRRCPGSHIPRPVMVGTPRLLSSIATPYQDVTPSRRSSATIGANWAARVPGSSPGCPGS